MSQVQPEVFIPALPFTTAAGTRIERIELKRLTVKDLKLVRKISKDPADWDESLIARSTGFPTEDTDNMDLADYLELQNRFQKITGWARSTETMTKAQGCWQRWFRFQPGKLTLSILTIWKCGWNRLKNRSPASTATNRSMSSRQWWLFCVIPHIFIFPGG